MSGHKNVCIYSVLAPSVFTPHLQFIYCYIARYYVKKIARATGGVKDISPLSWQGNIWDGIWLDSCNSLARKPLQYYLLADNRYL